MTDDNKKLYTIFERHQGALIDKWEHYIDIYERHFNRFKGQIINILEIGIYNGGSLQLWKKYFGDKVTIYGIDIDPACKQYEEENIKIFIGSQEDRSFLQSVIENLPDLDIIIDDGGHTMLQQIISFEELYDKLKEDGIYLIEDLHTSYWKAYEGGYRKKTSFIEYSKKFIDQLNAWHSKNEKIFRPDQWSKTIYGLHYYDSILVVEKNRIAAPKNIYSGRPNRFSAKLYFDIGDGFSEEYVIEKGYCLEEEDINFEFDISSKELLGLRFHPMHFPLIANNISLKYRNIEDKEIDATFITNGFKSGEVIYFDCNNPAIILDLPEEGNKQLKSIIISFRVLSKGRKDVLEYIYEELRLKLIEEDKRKIDELLKEERNRLLENRPIYKKIIHLFGNLLIKWSKR